MKFSACFPAAHLGAYLCPIACRETRQHRAVTNAGSQEAVAWDFDLPLSKWPLRKPLIRL
jgi:hypothetical protein